MASSERVLAALNHEETDRLPRYEVHNPGFVEAWKRAGLPDLSKYCRNDIEGVQTNNEPWPSEEKILEETDRYTIFRDGWGMILKRLKTRREAITDQPLWARIEAPSDLDRYPFEPADSLIRWKDWKESLRLVKCRGLCPQVRVGGPFNRASRIRGYERFMADLIARPDFAGELMDRITDLQAGMGVCMLRDPELEPKIVQIHDEIASTERPMVSPRLYNALIQPRLKRMVDRLKKEGGAQHVGMQADGNVRPLVDFYVEAGITTLRSIEPRAGMDPVELKKTYGKRLALIGAIDNNIILPSGDKRRIRDHVLYTLQAAQGGGMIIGPESISQDISVDSYRYYLQLLDVYGVYPLDLRPERTL